MTSEKMTLIQAVWNLDSHDEPHLARLLILLLPFEQGDKGIDSLSKLAKLDFLLRYPICLAHALTEIGSASSLVGLREFERNSVESAMVRYKYGPWDVRYRKHLNILVAKELVQVSQSGNAVKIRLTSKGRKMATELTELPEFEDVSDRAQLIHQHFDKSGAWLSDFIYSTFPGIAKMRSGAEI